MNEAALARRLAEMEARIAALEAALKAQEGATPKAPSVPRRKKEPSDG